MVQVIVIAQGIEVRDWENTRMQKFLADNCDPKGPKPAAGANNTWTYPKGAGAKATHEIRVVYAMADLATALNMKGAFVVYEGHSRYGQGPAFGPGGIPHVPDIKAFPVNPWGIHFKMGYDATDTECIGDIFSHSVMPAEYDLPAAGAKAFLPDLLLTAATTAQDKQKAIKAKKISGTKTCSISGAWRSMDTCQPAVATNKTARGETPNKGRHYFRHEDWKKPEEFLTAVKVGHTDLDKASLACSLFFMASCSSKVHFHKPLVNRRKDAKSTCVFLLTALACSASHGLIFLKQVLIKGNDPTTRAGLKKVVKALNGETDSGIVGVY